MEVLIEDKKKLMHKMVDDLDEERIDKAMAMLKLSSIKVNRDPSKAISGEELKKRLFKHIEALPWKK
ncbi:MAG: hypothetical protein ACOVP5_06565 [Chitinophagales bacterium]